jgi:hypothetical protein
MPVADRALLKASRSAGSEHAQRERQIASLNWLKAGRVVGCKFFPRIFFLEKNRN